MSLEDGRCDRCGTSNPGFLTGSMFDTSMICRSCSEIEKEHPEYERARKTEADAVRGGDYNFPGIGVPADLGARSKA